ncbi:MAG: flavin reductase [Lachnospiraceae bacterium]|nr:flavin reductase [Lachnospiraceae bacterium]
MDLMAMNKLTYGLFVLTARMNGKDNGCIINTVQQVTVEPNRITVAVNKANYTHDMICEAKKFNVSILSEKADFEIFKRFGFQSGRNTDKFANWTGYETAPNGISYITQGTNAYLSANVVEQKDLGSHTLFIAEVIDLQVLDAAPSVTYSYYHSHIKPKPQEKQALAEEAKGQSVWRCEICGYEYVGEELPADYICPVCKHPASDFVRVEK